MSSPLLRASDVADHLGWSLQRVYRMAAQKRIPHVRIGRGIFFEGSELEDWIARQRVTPDQPSPSAEALRVAERARLGIPAAHLFS